MHLQMRMKRHYTYINRTDMRFLTTLLKTFLLTLAVSGTACAQSHESNLPQATDLNKLGKTAEQHQTPIVLVIVSDSCPYCQLLEEEILRPMQLSGEYDQKIHLQVLNQNQSDYRLDFDGNARSPQEIADRYHVRMVPTVLFLGPRGEELAERLTGISVIDYYWGYLDQAIEEARGKLRPSQNGHPFTEL
jgi:thioredoxin-related protein